MDDTSSFGPETLTLVPTADGMYRDSVPTCSEQSADGALGIASSGARVQVFGVNGLIRTYTPPSASAGAGNTWRVFVMSVDGGAVSATGVGYLIASRSCGEGMFS